MWFFVFYEMDLRSTLLTMYIDCRWRHVRNWFSSIITHQCSHTSHSRVKLKYLLQMRGKNNRATPLITLENPFLAHHLLTSHAILLLGTHNIQYKKSIWFYLAFHSPFPLQWKKGTQLGQRRYLNIKLPKFKNWFLAFFEIAKNGIWSKKLFVNLIYMISRVILA